MIALPAAVLLALIEIGTVTVRVPAAVWALPLSGAGETEPPRYRSEDREVSNWREATRRTLEPGPLAAAATLLRDGRPVVTRCVKLNNPWCIKRARWEGEIGADDEGHTAFASPEAGADAAAALLRTYYVTRGLRSATDIVGRWAPAECRIGAGAGLSAVLAVRGLANTLRARYLVAVRTGTAPSRTARGGRRVTSARVRVSIVPLRPLPGYRVPDLAAGLGERPVRRAASSQERGPARATPPGRAGPVRVAALGAKVPVGPVSLCGTQEGRIAAYAGAIARALGVGPGDDLALFDEAGRPTGTLLPVMVAMSAVELGFLHAGPELAEGAVGRLRARLADAAARAAASEAPAPGD